MKNFMKIIKLLLIIFLVSLLPLNSQGQKSPLQGVRGPVTRVEPTYWWTNMHNPDLQIMLHGRDISKCDVSINYPGITITDKKLTDNPRLS